MILFDKPPRFPVIVEHIVTKEGKTICSGADWQTVNGLPDVPRSFCGLCHHFMTHPPTGKIFAPQNF